MSGKKPGLASLLYSSFKLNFLQSSWNFERLQNIGFLFAIYNILKKLYGGEKEKLQKAIERHISFFNTHIFFSSAVLGVMARLEEDIDGQDQEKKAAEIDATKLGIMGPLAAIGDSLFWSGIRPFALLCGLGVIYLSDYSEAAFIWSVAASLLIYNVPRVTIKSYLLIKAYYNYRELFSLIQRVKFQDIMRGLKITGLGLSGGVLAGFLVLKEKTLIKAEILDNLLLMLIYVAITGALRKKVSLSRIFAAIVLISVVLAYII